MLLGGRGARFPVPPVALVVFVYVLTSVRGWLSSGWSCFRGGGFCLGFRCWGGCCGAGLGGRGHGGGLGRDSPAPTASTGLAGSPRGTGEGCPGSVSGSVPPASIRARPPRPGGGRSSWRPGGARSCRSGCLRWLLGGEPAAGGGDGGPGRAVAGPVGDPA